MERKYVGGREWRGARENDGEMRKGEGGKEDEMQLGERKRGDTK